MIRWDDFIKQVKEVCILVGQNPKQEQMEAIYKKIKDYDYGDFLKACDDDELLKEWAHKISYIALQKVIMKHQINRQEAEYAEEKKKREEEEKKFWRNNYEHIKQGICNRKCYECHVEYCDLIAKESIAGMRAILSKEKTSAEVHKELARKFPGVGFEEFAKNEPF